MYIALLVQYIQMYTNGELPGNHLPQVCWNNRKANSGRLEFVYEEQSSKEYILKI